MKKNSCFVVIFIFIFSQSGFSDELLGISSPKGPIRIDSSQNLSSNVVNLDTGGYDLIGFGSDKTWQIHPAFEFQTTYDSNVNREPPGQRNEDIILRYIPSVEIIRKGSQLEALLGYEMNFEEYLRDSDQNAFNHIAKTSIKYTRHRLKTTLDERFSWIRAYPSSEQSERRTIMINEVNPEIQYRVTPKFSVSSIYRNYLFQYKESALEDYSYDVNEIGGRLYYHFTPKLDFYVQGSGTMIDYFESALFNSHGYSILAGSKGQVTKKLDVTLAAGYKGTRYDDPTLNSFDGWVVEGVVQYRVSRKVNIGLSAKRDKEESVYQKVGFYRNNSVGLNVSYKITSRITIILDGAIARNVYPRATTEGTRYKTRKDTLWTTGAKVNWKPVRFLTLSVGYGSRERDSNFDNLFEYIDHTLDTSVKCKF